ncbi:MAG: two-component sensor histidine kinase, partial [Sulfurimonas sp.]|nr:two-component sensor histidine kinase [Sulfurimonas sp.]
MKDRFNNLITSGFDFSESQMDIKSRYQMLNAGILLSTIGLIYGITGNIIKGIEGFIAVEFTLLLFNLILI